MGHMSLRADERALEVVLLGLHKLWEEQGDQAAFDQGVNAAIAGQQWPLCVEPVDQNHDLAKR